MCLCTSLINGLTGNPQSDFMGGLAGFFMYNIPLDQEYLPGTGKVQVTIKRGATPDAPRFNSAVVGRRDLDEIRLFPIFEEQGNIRLERGLIVFSGEVVMRAAPNHIGSKLRCVRSASVVISLPSMSIASSSDMNMPISLVCLVSSHPSTGKVPTFFGCSTRLSRGLPRS